MSYARRFVRFVPVALFASVAVAHAQPIDPDLQNRAKEVATEFLQNNLPTFLELYWLDNKYGEESLALRYDWNSSKEWEATDFGSDTASAADGTQITNFGGRRSNVFARGNYAQQDGVNPSELSEIGGEWSRRWFPVYAANPLSQEQKAEVDQCLLNSTTFGVTNDDCRERLGFGRTEMSFWYFDIDAHAKIEGDQQFDQRHYVYGVHTNFSRKLGSQRAILYPILTLGLEQVDPADDTARSTVLNEDDRYDRLYAAVGFTGPLGKLRGQSLKYSVSIRYFKELGANAAIEAADLDTFRYSAFAVQIPAAVIPGFDNTRNSFTLSYATGELPFNRGSEKTFELGFQHDIDFGEFF